MKNYNIQHFFAICLVLITLTSCNNSKQKVNKTDAIEEISVIFYNIRNSAADDGENSWQNRRKATINMIEKETPMIIGVQEALLDQVQYIEEMLPQYTRIGVGRDDGKEEGEFMAVFFLTDKFELLENNTFWLSESPKIPSKGWDAACYRTMTYVKLREKTSQKNICFFNTHFDHVGEIAREESAKLIVKLIDEITTADDAIIFGGDLNSSITDDIFSPIKENLIDARLCSPVADNKGTYNAYGDVYEDNVIDHVFCKNVKCILFKTLIEDYGAPYISDHYPIKFVFCPI